MNSTLNLLFKCKNTCILLVFLCASITLRAQGTQTIRGTVLELETQASTKKIIRKRFIA